LQARLKNKVEVKTGSTAGDEHAYFCRGCGNVLPADFRGHFHKACLQRDKRRRVREQRQQQHKQFTRWLRKKTCQKCGARFGQPEGVAEIGCEASQRP
jgi:hypothetical protein